MAGKAESADISAWIWAWPTGGADATSHAQSGKKAANPNFTHPKWDIVLNSPGWDGYYYAFRSS